MMRLADLDTRQRYQATVAANHRLTGPTSTEDVRELTLAVDRPGPDFRPGQSVAVILPGPHPQGHAEHLRLYTVADTPTVDDDGRARIVICVRRCSYLDPYSGERYPGVASNWLCDRRPGDATLLAGPYGSPFEVPAERGADLLLIGLGTGIAPFRAFVRHIYEDLGGWEGRMTLFYGARTGLEMLYMNDQRDDFARYLDQGTFEAFRALSPRPDWDEPTDIEAALAAHQETVWEMLCAPHTHVSAQGRAGSRGPLGRAPLLKRIRLPLEHTPARKMTMDDTITAAAEGWYLVEPLLEDGKPVSIRRIPVVAWRIGAEGAVPVALGGHATPKLGKHVGVMHPSGAVWFGESEYASVRVLMDTLRRRPKPARSTSGAATSQSEAEVPGATALREDEIAAPVPARLLDPELTEEDAVHTMVELLNVHGHEFILHHHEWIKALALARDNGWTARGTRHDAVAGWEGRYDDPHNQRVRADDARGFAEALERAVPVLPPQREADFVQHSSDSILVALSPADYLGGVKGQRFVEALIAYAREGEFRIT
jgi:ferredoxin--NADP+ reductase